MPPWPCKLQAVAPVMHCVCLPMQAKRRHGLSCPARLPRVMWRRWVLLAIASGAAPRYFSGADLPAKPLSMSLLATWSRELLQAARTADHPFNAGLMTEALAARARSVLISGKVARTGRPGN